VVNPTRNVTGLSFDAGNAIVGKRLEWLKRAIPGARRIAYLHPRWAAGRAPWPAETTAAARTLGLELVAVAADGPDDFDPAFAEILRMRPDAITGFDSPLNIGNRARIIEFARRERLPVVFGLRQFAEAGALLSYGVNLPEVERRAALYVDKILKGAKAERRLRRQTGADSRHGVCSGVDGEPCSREHRGRHAGKIPHRGSAARRGVRDGRIRKAADPARSLGFSEPTARRCLDALTRTFMLRQLQPWHSNVEERRGKAPKVYFRDSGLLHALLRLKSLPELLAHPICGASWEGFALEQLRAWRARTQRLSGPPTTAPSLTCCCSRASAASAWSSSAPTPRR
jgi:hypothetical protein